MPGEAEKNMCHGRSRGTAIKVQVKIFQEWFRKLKFLFMQDFNLHGLPVRSELQRT